MPLTMIMSGWLHKTCRFSLLHSLHERYFILTDRELRHYKHPDDLEPTFVIDLKNCRVEYHGTIHHHHKELYGIRLVPPTTQHHTLPDFYTETKQERDHWIDKIQFVIDRLAAFAENRIHISGRELVLTRSKRDYEGLSVLDKWLDRLNLVCDSDTTPSPVSSSNSSSGKSTPISLENHSLESLFQVGYFLENSEDHREQKRHCKMEVVTPPRQPSDTKTAVNKLPIKSLLKQRELYASRSHSKKKEETFDSKLAIPLSPRPSPFSSFILK